MQRLPTLLLEELQQQRAGEAQEEDRGAGDTPEGGGTMASGASSAGSETSFPFPSASFLPPPPSSPSLLGQGARIPKRPTLQIPGREGGRGDRNESGLESQQATTISRPGSGQTASGPPPRPPASSSLSPQLLGGYTGPDANLLMVRSDSMKDYKSGQQEVLKAQMQALLSSTPSPIRVPSLSASLSIKRQESVLITPASETSHYSYAEIPESSTSGESTASSFAYHLRRKEPDTRLLKKKSKPSQHLIKKPSVLKPVPGAQRSPSFYQPKVVDDTGFVEPTTAGIQPPSPPNKPFALTLTKSMRVNSNPPIKPLRKAQTLKLQPTGKPSVISLQTTSPAKKGVISMSRSSSSLQRPDGLSRQLRFQCPQIVEFNYIESASNLALMAPPKDRPRKPPFALDQVPVNHKPRFHAVTPAKTTPVTPGKPSFRHDDSYFPILGIDAMPDKGFVPPRSPAPETPGERKTEISEQLRPDSDPTPKRSLSLVKRMTMSSPSPLRQSTASMKARKQSRVFSVFRKTQLNDEVFEEHHKDRNTSPLGSPSPLMTPATPATPGIKIHSPVESSTFKRRMSSIVPDLAVPSYFARPRPNRNRSDSGSTSRSLDASPMSTVDDDGLHSVPRFGGRTRGHNRSSSEQLSPRTKPRTRSRSRRRQMLENLSNEVPRQPTPSTGESSRFIGQTIAEPRNAEGNVPVRQEDVRQEDVSQAENAIVLPPAMDTSDIAAVVKQNAAVKKKASVFRGFFLDLRKMSSADKIPFDEDIPVTPADRHRFAMIPKVSLPALKLRTSMATFSTRFRRKVRRQQQAADADVNDDNAREASSDEDAEPSRGQSAPSPAAEQSHESLEPLRITAKDLVVTQFEATPFSQRYHDARKAETQHIRSLIEDTLDEDDEEDDDIVLGFEQNVPEHFPNSPLCPLHPKHKSGGKAICPQHRRYRKSNAARVVKVGPARSNRVISYTRIAPKESRQPSPETTVVGDPPPEIMAAVREEDAKARRRMGSDGASTISSLSSEEWYEIRQAAWAKSSMAAADVKWRGRTLLRDGCGSARKPRRRRIQRR